MGWEQWNDNQLDGITILKCPHCMGTFVDDENGRCPHPNCNKHLYKCDCDIIDRIIADNSSENGSDCDRLLKMLENTCNECGGYTGKDWLSGTGFTKV